MDLDKLIDLIKEHRCVWDPSDTKYHVRDQQSRSWFQISEEMGIPVEKLKKKWRGLRDTFGRELKKKMLHKPNQADNDGYDSQWRYFQGLEFLKDTVTRRDSALEKFHLEKVIFDDDATSESETGDASTGFDKVVARNNDQTLPNWSTDSPPLKKVKIEIEDMPDDIDTKLSQNGEDEIKYFEMSAIDSDTQFLMSLRPYLNAVPKHRKLLVRTKLEQVLINEQYAPLEQCEYASDS